MSGSSKKTIGATVTEEMRSRIKRVAEQKHWSVGQTLSLFIDAHWEKWEAELGLGATEPAPLPKPKKSKSL